MSSPQQKTQSKSSKKVTTQKQTKPKTTKSQKVQAPRSKEVVVVAPIAKQISFQKESPNCIIVRQRELIGPLSNSGAAGNFVTLMRLRCNPGSAATFAWLSKLAPLFEFYRFRKLQFKAITRAPTTLVGSLVMSPDYDAADGEIAVTEQFLFNNVGTTESPVYEKEKILSLLPSRMNALYKKHVVMSDSRFAVTTQDEKTIDCAQVFICTDCNSSVPFAKLVVDYEVELHVPQAPTDPVQQGGFQLNTPILNSSQNAPLGGPVASQAQEAVPILQTALGLTYPSSVVGQFTRDWEGPLTSILTGTGFGGTFHQFLVDNVTGSANTPTAIVQQQDGNYQSGASTLQETVSYVSAKAGQYLKFMNPATVTSAAVLRLIAGGASNFNNLA